ncbi:hypothetical protein SEA_WEASELS2_156 [Rhodococcus phage Weasels2]|uniref:Uncharacterized protein n=1 Tax=Rhodococcus phage Weasels2 TaxID=1897437 RepID=A0A1I9SAD0_9CAUD|nr:hypothetical protein FDH04_gp258 [Rhodococcus phage Weasels2]AOZ63736.1 hypothetical protein SEA_WEASELS2_156 [Rhodococcus phage Weasels2]
MPNGDLTRQNKSLRTKVLNQRKEIKTLVKRLENVETLNSTAYLQGYAKALELMNGSCSD